MTSLQMAENDIQKKNPTNFLSCCHESREMVELINSDPTILDPLVTCDESWIYCYDPETKRQSSQWKHAGSPRPKKARKNLEAVVMRQIRRWKRLCDEGHWHAHTKGLPWGLPEDVGTVQQVHCSRRRLLRRGLGFHACTPNKSAHTKKVWKLI